MSPQLGAWAFRKPASPYAERVNDFHNLLLVIIGVISLFVSLLLLFVMVRFNERANPVPSRTTHNTRLEVVWTIGPILILILIAIFSFPLLYFGDVIPDSKYTVKVTGHQWYWSYEYETPEGEVFSFDSLLLTDAEATAAGLPRLLAVDEPMVLPVGTPVRFVITAADVLHAFAVPAFAVKTDAVPGRLNETWAEVLRPGYLLRTMLRALWHRTRLYADYDLGSQRRRVFDLAQEWTRSLRLYACATGT